MSGNSGKVRAAVRGRSGAWAVSAAVLTLLAGCNAPSSGLSQADYQHLMDRTPPPAQGPAAPPPIPALQPILAAPPAPGLDQRLVSVNVTDPKIPVRDVLVELARKVGVDLDLDPNVQGGIIFSATDRPFSEVIQRICDLANLRYTFKNNVLNVAVDSMYYTTYHMDILNTARSSTSTISTSTDVSSSVQGGGGASAGNSQSQVTTASPGPGGNDPWTEINTNLIDILANSNPAAQPITSNVAQTQTTTTVVPAGAAAAPGAAAVPPTTAAGTTGTATGAAAAGAGGTTPQSAGLVAQLAGAASSLGNAAGATGAANANAAAAAATPAVATIPTPAKATFDINRNSGLVTVFGTSRQQVLVKDYLAAVLQKANAQVLIEAKVVEVDLNHQYAAGIDWSKVWNYNGGFSNGGSSFTLNGPGALNGTATAGSAIVTGTFGSAAAPIVEPIGYANAANNLSAMLDLIQQFGTVRTLSSPRLTVMNNQTAVLKVAENEVYFSVTATVTPSTVAGTSPTVTATGTLHTVPIGLVMTVQPSIDTNNNQVTMSLRPTVSQQVGSVNDPTIAITFASACGSTTTGACSTTPTSSIPVVEVRELD